MRDGKRQSAQELLRFSSMADTQKTTEALDLAAFIDASPSPYHAVEEVTRRLRKLDFREHVESDAWSLEHDRGYVRRGGTIIAWVRDVSQPPHTAFRIAGAHTDSPNLRVKPRPDTESAGVRQVGVEVYGGVLLNSWLDRDLGLSGRVFARGDATKPLLFRVDRAVLRVPQLAIHLHPEIRTDGLKLNAQQHMAPIWGLGTKGERGFKDLLASELDIGSDEILSWDVMTHDLTPSRLLGDDDVFLAAPRLDNLCSCHGALRALERALADGNGGNCVLSFFDHEEVGSGSNRGADSPALRDILERLVLAGKGTREDLHRSLASSRCVSMDMAHATHPNYVAMHEPDHKLNMNGGPVVKINANQRYATEGSSEAWFQAACESADVPYQRWVNRTDLACGSTIGPITAAQLGVSTVDVGLAQLSMHSAREVCGSHDPELMIRAMTAFFGAQS